MEKTCVRTGGGYNSGWLCVVLNLVKSPDEALKHDHAERVSCSPQDPSLDSVVSVWHVLQKQLFDTKERGGNGTGTNGLE
jgi:hypothetical protein